MRSRLVGHSPVHDCINYGAFLLRSLRLIVYNIGFVWSKKTIL